MTLRQEGWAWLEIWPEPDFERLNRFGRAKTVAVKLSKKDEKRLNKLGERYDELITALEDENEQKGAGEFDQVSAELQTLQSKTVAWAESAKATIGAIVYWGSASQPTFEPGLYPSRRSQA